MFSAKTTVAELIGDYHIEGLATRYSLFVPRLYNLCRSLGFEPGRIMPSRAFCSDESQGYPIILIAKHFGTFPFNHGMVGGIIATDRHGPHAHHGKDLVIIHASHVGYDPDTKRFGSYRRLQTELMEETASCGKVCATTSWYEQEYRFARANITLRRAGGERVITIDNQLLHMERDEGLILQLDRLVAHDGEGRPRLVKGLSTAKSFVAAGTLVERLGEGAWIDGEERPIGDGLAAECFFFRGHGHGQIHNHPFSDEEEGRAHVENNLLPVMQYIVTAREPALVAAQVNTQVEFDRAFRSMVKAPEYQGKRVLFISGLNIDVSPQPGFIFPLTKFVPWAAYHQKIDGTHRIWEQAEVAERLAAQSTENPDQVDLEAAIRAMEEAKEVRLEGV